MSARARTSGERRASESRSAPAPRPAALTVRRANASDATPLEFFFDTALRRDYFIRRGQLAEILGGKHHQMYVAEIDAVLVGVAITTRGSRLINALVHPAYRGLGIGRALIEASGATEVRAKIDMSAGDPREFYKSLGFVPTGQFNEKGNIEILRMPAKAGAENGKRRAAAR